MNSLFVEKVFKRLRIFARSRPRVAFSAAKPNLLHHPRQSLCSGLPLHHTVHSSLSALKAIFPLKGGRRYLYQIFINYSVFFLQKARTLHNAKRHSALRRKDFCPSGSRCFDEYLGYFKNPAHPTVTVRRLQPASLSFALPFVYLFAPLGF